MGNLAIWIGAILIAIGVGGYAGTGGQSVTALIPAGLGVLMLGAGLIARRETLRRHAMHGAIVVALLGLIGSAGGIGGAVQWIAGDVVERPVAVMLQTATAVLCAAFIVMAIRSFVLARKARAAS